MTTPETPANIVGEKELFESRFVLLSGPVNAKLAYETNSKLYSLERAARGEPIYVQINSPGGEMHAGFAIFDTIRFIDCPVYTIVSGIAASMGTVIALAAQPKFRFAMPNAKFLIHQPSIHGGLAGSVSDIEIHAKDLIETKNQLVQLYQRETGRTEAEIRKALDRDYWMNSQQALEFGLIQKIVRNRTDLQESK